MLASLTDDQRLEACGEDPGPVCDWVADRTSSTTVAQAADLLVDRPLQILLIVVVAIVASRLGRRLVTRAVRRVAGGSVQGLSAIDQRRLRRRRRHGRSAEREEGRADEAAPRSPLVNGEGSRLELRIETLAAVAGSLVTAVVWSVAFVVTLGLFDISLAPLFAGAGVVGIALGFGAQSVVADFLSGFFMLFEDQYGVGDVVDVGDATGTVEKFSLRTTTVRDVNGTVWHIPNSEIRRVGNKSQVWSRAVLDIDVAYDTDLRRAEGIIQRVADDLWRDADFDGGDIIDPPEVWGVERLGADGVSIRLVVKTDPAEQWIVGRELRLRIKEALDEAGIEIPFPQRTVWIRQDEAVPRHARPDVETAPLRGPEASEELVDNPGG
ncbi:MAG: mechanosensitive ion channel family protein [Actinomycetota bacterium]